MTARHPESDGRVIADVRTSERPRLGFPVPSRVSRGSNGGASRSARHRPPWMAITDGPPVTALSLPLVVVGLLVSSALALPMGRRFGPRTGFVLSAVCVAALAIVGWQGVTVLETGEPLRYSVPWLPSAGVEFAFLLDGLSLLFSGLVLGIGAVVLAYCPAYISGHVSRVGTFYATLIGFAGAMLGLVLAADAVALYVFWELTTIASFLLIRHRGDAEAARAARRALLITFLGGLCLLGGVVIAGNASGTFDLLEWIGEPGSLGGSAVPVLLLLLIAVATKSAQAPFHVWLPGAMSAPTPVSAYLHAAAMVKAGVYLMARFVPLFAAHPGLQVAVIGIGLATAVIGSLSALRRDDLKVVLAYSTIGQLGLMIALLGVGTGAAVAAALLHAVAHAAYKSSLFLVAGTIEHEHDTRDLRRMGGVGASMPATAAVAVLALASMAGLPPLLGFVSKEELLSSLSESGDIVALIVVVGALALTVAYSLRILVAGLVSGRSSDRRRPPAAMVIAPGVVALFGGLGLGVSVLDDPIGRAAEAATGHGVEVELGLWHGPTIAFWAATTATILGVLLYLARAAIHRVPPVRDGAELVDAIQRGLRRFGGRLARPLISPVPAWHLTAIVVVAVLVLVAAWPAQGWSSGSPWDAPVAEWVVAGLLVVAAAGVAQARDRFAGLAVLASVGFLVAALYVLRGAPDLALTQLVVDALSVALIAFVFRHLPRDYPRVSRPRALTSLGVALVAGLVVGAISLQMTARTELSEVAHHYLETAPEEGGNNVVNAIITGFRPLDTFGEITVLAVAAAGVVALLRASTGDGS